MEESGYEGLGQAEREKMTWHSRRRRAATSPRRLLESLPTAAGDNYDTAAGNIIELDSDRMSCCSFRCVFIMFLAFMSHFKRLQMARSQLSVAGLKSA